MWWTESSCRDAVVELIALLRHGLPEDRFEVAVEPHRVDGRWVLVVAFQQIDCDFTPGGIATHVITEGDYATASSVPGGPANVARVLYGQMEAAEGDRDQEGVKECDWTTTVA